MANSEIDRLVSHRCLTHTIPKVQALVEKMALDLTLYHFESMITQQGPFLTFLIDNCLHFVRL